MNEKFKYRVASRAISPFSGSTMMGTSKGRDWV